MPLISLIVPFFNEKRHLRRCITSIQEQTFTDFEALIVDDLSTDGSYALVESLTTGDSHFRLMHSDAKGLYNARNKALSEAKGKYICFLDADDELLPDYLLGLYEDALIKPVDIVIQGYSHVFADHSEDYRVNIAGHYELLSTAAFDSAIVDCSLFSAFDLVAMAHIPGKLYLKDLVDQHHLRFSEHVLICEDMFFFLSFLTVCSKVYLSERSNYHYIANGNSMTSSYWTFETEQRSYLALQQVWQRLLVRFECPALLSAYGSFTGSYINRMIFSALTHPANKEMCQKNLDIIDAEFLPVYRQCYSPYTFFTKCLKKAALSHLYWLYRFLMQLAILRYRQDIHYC